MWQMPHLSTLYGKAVCGGSQNRVSLTRVRPDAFLDATKCRGKPAERPHRMCGLGSLARDGVARGGTGDREGDVGEAMDLLAFAMAKQSCCGGEQSTLVRRKKCAAVGCVAALPGI
jgi:hypothetical protein